MTEDIFCPESIKTPEELGLPSAYTIRHMGEWLKNHAPIDPDIEYWRYAGALMRWLDDGGKGRWEWALNEGWPRAFRSAESDGYFESIEAG